MYSDFSAFYDLFAYDIPYKEFLTYYRRIFKKFNRKPELVLDICCGTGSLTTLLSSYYDVTGIDSSVEMLDIARKKDKEGKILYLNQSMTDFELYGTVDAVISSLDSINYIIDKNDLKRHFGLVKNYLNNGGIYIFDISSAYKFKNILADNTFSDERGGVLFLWQNDYDNISKLNTMYIDIFYRLENDSYKRISETHYERAYSVSEVSASLKSAGLEILGIYDNLNFLPYEKTSERIFFAVQKNGDFL